MPQPSFPASAAPHGELPAFASWMRGRSTPVGPPGSREAAAPCQGPGAGPLPTEITAARPGLRPRRWPLPRPPHRLQRGLTAQMPQPMPSTSHVAPSVPNGVNGGLGRHTAPTQPVTGPSPTGANGAHSLARPGWKPRRALCPGARVCRLGAACLEGQSCQSTQRSQWRLTGKKRPAAPPWPAARPLSRHWKRERACPRPPAFAIPRVPPAFL